MKKQIIFLVLAMVLATMAFGQKDSVLIFPKTTKQPIQEILRILNDSTLEFYYYNESSHKMTPLSCPDCEVNYKREEIAYRKKVDLTPKGGEVRPQDTLFLLGSKWSEIPETVILKLQQPKQKEEEPRYGLHIFVGEVLARDFRDDHQINERRWSTTRIGIETSPWGNPWDGEIHLGFYPRSDFKQSFALPTVGENPAPDEGWCDCETRELKSVFSVGAGVSRHIPLLHLAGELGLRPTLTGDFNVSKRPVKEEKRWALPGAVSLSLPIFWQTHLKKPSGEKAGATATLGFGPSWQFAKGAEQGLALELFGKLSLGTKIGAPKPKPGTTLTPTDAIKQQPADESSRRHSK